MTLSDHQANFLDDIASLIRLARDVLGVKITAGEFYRPQWVQDVYVESGKSWTQNSRHSLRLAADFNLFDGGSWQEDELGPVYAGGVYRTATEAYRELGRYWESLSPFNVWAVRKDGRLTDGNHFERRTTRRSATRDEEDAALQQTTA